MSLRAAILPVTAFQQNCTLLFDDQTKRGAVVDPGGDVDNILDAISQIGITVEKLLLTHGHIDHAGGAAELCERLVADGRHGDAVPIEGPDPRDRFLLQGLAAQGREYGLKGARDVLPDRWLEEGDEVTVAGVTLSVLHCPGHTPGSIVMVQHEQRFALVGDVLFRGSVGRTDFPYGDQEALLDAIRTKLFPLGDDISFICGHGPGGTIGEERRSNPFVRG